MARDFQKDMTIGSTETPADQRQPNRRSAYPIPTPAVIDPKNTLSRIAFPRRVCQKGSRFGPPIFSASLSCQRLIAFAQTCSAAQADHSRTAPPVL
jgi:hypothetical protein